MSLKTKIGYGGLEGSKLQFLGCKQASIEAHRYTFHQLIVPSLRELRALQRLSQRRERLNGATEIPGYDGHLPRYQYVASRNGGIAAVVRLQNGPIGVSSLPRHGLLSCVSEEDTNFHPVDSFPGILDQSEDEPPRRLATIAGVLGIWLRGKP